MEHSPRKIVANTLLFTGTLVLQKVVSFTYFWFLTSRLDPSLLGTYIWALSITGVFSIGIDLGLSPLLIRESARDPVRGERLLRNVLGLKVLFTFATLALLAVTILLSKRDIITLIVVAVGVVVMLFDSFTMSFYSVLRARQQIRYEALGMFVTQILVFVIGSYLLGIAKSPIFAMLALAIGSGANLIYSLSAVRFRLRFRIWPKLERETADILLRMLPAFAASGIFVRLYNVADSVLLGYFANQEAVGLYSVPAKVVTAFQMLIPGAFIASIYPAMSHFFRADRTMLERLFSRSVGYLLAFVFPIMAALLTLGPTIISAIWPKYVSVIPTFLLMSTSLPFLFLAFPTGYFLNATDREKQNTANRGLVMAVNIILNLILIRPFGVFGAGIAFVATSALLVILDWRNVREVIPIEWSWLARVGLKSALASVLMAIAVYLTRLTLPLPALVALGIFVYCVLMLVLRAFSREEFLMIANIVRRKAEPQEISPPQILNQ